jgi:hypothetical protein
MFQERRDVADSISIAELTYVTAAPSAQIAASSRSAPSAVPAAPAPAAAPATPADVNIEKLANDVYKEILAMMDIARARNGEPYL